MTVHACNRTDPVVTVTADPCPCAGIALTMLRHLPSLAKAGLVARDLTAPFARIVDQEVTNPWLRSLMDLECFVLRWGLGGAWVERGAVGLWMTVISMWPWIRLLAAPRLPASFRQGVEVAQVRLMPPDEL